MTKNTAHLFSTSIILGAFSISTFLCFELSAQQTNKIHVIEKDNVMNDFNEAEIRKKMEAEGLTSPVIDKLIAQRKLIIQKNKGIPVEHNDHKSGGGPVPFGTCTEIGVESGWASWQCYLGTNGSGNPPTFSGPVIPAAPRIVLNSGGIDPCTPGVNPGDPTIPLVAPGFGSTSIQLGEQQAFNSKAEQLRFPLTVTAQDTNFVYAFAAVFFDPPLHPVYNKPYVDFVILTATGDTVPCSYQHYISDANQPGFYQANTSCVGSPDTWYKPWTVVGVNLGNYVSQNLTVIITNVDCAPGAHFAHSYWDFQCGPISLAGGCVVGQQATITAPASGGTTYSYQWYQNGIVIPGATSQNVTVTPAVGDTFSVQVSQPSGACPFYLTYVPGGGITPDFNYTDSCGVYTFTDSSFATPLGSGANITGWNWQFPGGTPATATTPIVNVTYPPGIYTVSLSVTSSSGCTAITTHTISSGGASMAANFNAPPVCVGNPTQFTDLSNGATSWDWDFGDGNTSTLQNPSHTYAANGSYTVTLIASAGGTCGTDTISIPVTFNPFPTAAFASTPPCLGNSTQLTDGSLSPAGDPIVSWNWIMLGGAPAAATSQNTSTLYSTAGTHTVSLIVTTQQGCKDTIPQQVLVYNSPIANFSEPDSGCAPLCINYTDLSASTDGSINTWTWSFPGGTPSSSTVQHPQNICYTTPGSYGASLIVETNYGCKDTIDLPMAEVYPWPKADFCVTPLIAPTTDPVFNFCDMWSSDVVQWSWNFGDNDSDLVNSDPIHSYSASATENDFYAYNICIRVENQYTCWDTICKVIELVPEFTFYIPNTFTPNGDWMNEMFYGKSRGVKEYNIWLFDRWGNQIWDCHKEDKNTNWDSDATLPRQEGLSSFCQWDGKVVGGGADMGGNTQQLAQQDVYVWKVRLTDIFDKKHNYVGHVNIVR